MVQAMAITSQFQAQYARRGAAFNQTGTDVRDCATIDDVLQKSGLNFDLATAPILNATTGNEIKGKLAVYRTDTLQDLGVTGDLYKIIPPHRMLRAVGDVVRDANLAFTTAGAFHHGARVWLQAQFPQGFKVLGEPHDGYLTIQSGNDGGQALKFGVTSVRIVCWNTYQMAGAELGVKVRHYGDVEVQLMSAKELLSITSEAEERFAAWAEQMAAAKVTEAQMRKFEVALFRLSGDGKLNADDDKRIQQFRSIAGEEQAMAGQRNGWTLFNSITGYADHGKQTRGGAEGRWDSILNGSAANFKMRGVKLLEELVKG